MILGAHAGSRALPTDGTVSLLPGERDLSLSWAGLSFSHAERMRYRYTVSGLSGGAVETTASEATLAGLRSGSYRFEVAAIPAPGVPPGPPAVFSFTVAPLFLESWWTRGLLLLLAGYGAVLLFRARTSAVAAERDALRSSLERKEVELVQAGRRLEEAAITDALTGIRTRLFLSAAIQPEVERALRAHATFATAGERAGGGLLFLVVDLDGLKELDARMGDRAGDAVLVEMARRLKKIVRASDFLVRWDRSAFLVVTRFTGRTGGTVVAAKLLSAVGAEPVALPDGGAHRPTASVGWAPFPWLIEAAGAVPHGTVLAAAVLASGRAGRPGATARSASFRRTRSRRTLPAPARRWPGPSRTPPGEPSRSSSRKGRTPAGRRQASPAPAVRKAHRPGRDRRASSGKCTISCTKRPSWASGRGPGGLALACPRRARPSAMKVPVAPFLSKIPQSSTGT